MSFALKCKCFRSSSSSHIDTDSCMSARFFKHFLTRHWTPKERLGMTVVLDDVWSNVYTQFVVSRLKRAKAPVGSDIPPKVSF